MPEECGGWSDDCEYCRYYHDPCFPEFEEESFPKSEEDEEDEEEESE